MLSRIRAGAVGGSNLLAPRRCGAGMDQQGLAHQGSYLTDNDLMYISFQQAIGKQFMSIGPDLSHPRSIRELRGTEKWVRRIIQTSRTWFIAGADTNAPRCPFSRMVNPRDYCTYVQQACDGFHGVSPQDDPCRQKAQGIRTGLPFGGWGFVAYERLNDELILLPAPNTASPLPLCAAKV